MIVLLGLLPVEPALAEDHTLAALLVQFRPGTPAIVRSELHRSLGALQQRRLASLDLDIVSLTPSSKLHQVAARYARHAAVVAAEPDGWYEAVGSSSHPARVSTTAVQPNDPMFAQQWGLTRIGMPMAWTITQGREEIAIAVLDSGIALDHPDLARKIVASANFTSAPSEDDRFGQGTFVAGIAAAMGDNGIGTIGVAPRCVLMNGKVLGDDGRGLTSSIARGIDWALSSGAKVICMGFSSDRPSGILERLLNRTWDQGVVLVAATGYSDKSTPTYPAAYSHCLSVTATDAHDARFARSDFGPWVNVAAPGENILSTLPNVPNAWGMQGYGRGSGPSMSAGFVAGLAGLVWDTPWGTSNAAVRARIEATCDRIVGTGAQWSAGRINAARAVGALP
jgi:thermitase